MAGGRRVGHEREVCQAGETDRALLFGANNG
jgi:hypothetical protein